ncbi:MAG: hypothetical protein Q8R24_00130 [Legionellaceae bacterium]|nr:hypothetical protein [Legionellaceae bacterium]
MEKNKDCKVTACCTSHRCEIFGGIFLAIATVLTLLTYSGLGILGMFIVGMVFCCHKHTGFGRCRCGCCSTNMTTCDMPAPKKETAVAKKAATKK